MAKREVIAKETLPVADGDGKTVLGTCTVGKFTRTAGLPYNLIEVRDADDNPVAEICGYRLHSHVRCDDLETICARIDSKDAVAVARVALGCADKARRLAAVQEMADSLAAARAHRAAP